MGDYNPPPSMAGLFAELDERISRLELRVATPSSLVDFQIAATGASVASGVWVGIDANDPTVTVPRAGVWEVTSICTLSPATAAASVFHGVRIDTTDPVAGTNSAGEFCAAAGANACLTLTQRLTLTAGQVLAQRYFQNGGVQVLNRSGAMLMIRPIP